MKRHSILIDNWWNSDIIISYSGKDTLEWQDLLIAKVKWNVDYLIFDISENNVSLYPENVLFEN